MRILISIAFAIQVIAATPDLSELSRRYARDDQRLAGALRYEHMKDGIREQVWVLETGEIVKVACEKRGAKVDALEELSISGDGDVYFKFFKTIERAPDGTTHVTEERTYVGETSHTTRRTATFPPGAEPVIPKNAPSEKVDDSKPELPSPFTRELDEILDEVCVPKLLVHDPAKGAPPGWQRVKLVKGSLSPDGRYALAFAPDKRDFSWDDYVDTDRPVRRGHKSFWIEPYTENVLNYIADLKTHQVIGKTMGEHFGTEQRYNHRECDMVWSPDSRIFIELNSNKWSSMDCCIGHITNGKLDTVQNLDSAAKERAAQFLVATKHRGYRRHKESMEAALGKPTLKNDGTGSIDVTFQVRKSLEEDAIVSVRVSFRLQIGKNPPRLEMRGAALEPQD